MSKNKNKIEYLSSILCTGSSVDQTTNNLTVFNIIEKISVAKNQLKIPVEPGNNKEKKIIPIAFELITFWKKVANKEGVSAQIKITLNDPEGKMMQDKMQIIAMKPEHERLRGRMQINGIRVSKSGEYKYIIHKKEEHSKEFSLVGKVPFTIKILENKDMKDMPTA